MQYTKSILTGVGNLMIMKFRFKCAISWIKDWFYKQILIKYELLNNMVIFWYINIHIPIFYVIIKK